MNKIKVGFSAETSSQYPKQSCMRVTAFNIHGNTYVADVLNPIGHWMNPMSHDQQVTKFIRLTAAKLEIKTLVAHSL